jgi:hypothetical protein
MAGNEAVDLGHVFLGRVGLSRKSLSGAAFVFCFPIADGHRGQQRVANLPIADNRVGAFGNMTFVGAELSL